eukprot:TRINITY_DN7902_c0_g3_i2.p4 TRINITY_DN7902_c0_g3~~TRINITY_DN7902_c0_g3_i2.p4  ORF type:complete len:106 (+),score=3.71 TRINITY_DN7902_c0_g3_i2:850-1167(+)
MKPQEKQLNKKQREKILYNIQSCTISYRKTQQNIITNIEKHKARYVGKGNKSNNQQPTIKKGYNSNNNNNDNKTYIITDNIIKQLSIAAPKRKAIKCNLKTFARK